MSSIWNLKSSSSSIWRSKPLCILIQAFRVTIFLHLGIQNHFSSAISFRVIAPSIHIHWHCTSYLHNFTFVLIFLTSLPYAYRLFIMLFYVLILSLVPLTSCPCIVCVVFPFVLIPMLFGGSTTTRL